TQTSLSFGSWEGEATIVQYFQNGYDQGATSGFQYNQNNNNFNNIRWGNYSNPIKNLVQGLHNLNGDPTRTNLISMMRIWKALIFMNLVDTHGDVPYSEAGRAYLDGILAPSYDDDAAIYDDLYTEIKEASAALNPAGDIVTADLIYNGDVAKWKKMANSLLVRLGMRYSKLNPTKAASIVSEAVAAGVMQTNADDCVLFYNALFTNVTNFNLSNNNPRFYYLEKPLIDQFQLTNDPRSTYIAGMYPDPNTVLAALPDVTLANQRGFPVGYSDITVASSPGAPVPVLKGGGMDFSQPNYFALFSANAPRFFITNSQTKLLLAEAAFRGYITGSAQALYEEGIRASMDQYALYPGEYGPIDVADQNAYIANANVAYNATDALELINTEYWVSNVNNALEGWSNFRRSGFPTLTPNPYGGGLPGDGFVHRIPYPTQESGSNPDSYDAARAAMGIAADNSNDMTVRVFWDIP